MGYQEVGPFHHRGPGGADRPSEPVRAHLQCADSCVQRGPLARACCLDCRRARPSAWRHSVRALPLRQSAAVLRPGLRRGATPGAKYVSVTLTRARCAIPRELIAWERPCGNEELLPDYSLVPIYYRDIGVTSAKCAANASSKVVDKNGMTSDDWQSRWKPNPSDSNCAKSSDIQCMGTAGETRSPQDALRIPDIFTQNRAGVTDTITVPNKTYSDQLSWILCPRQKARTALYASLPGADPGSSAYKLSVNEKLQLLRGSSGSGQSCRGEMPLRLGDCGGQVFPPVGQRVRSDGIDRCWRARSKT
jgi:hypothetical protein